eukprot:228781-Pleurochrysis_carterae.AAC.3
MRSPVAFVLARAASSSARDAADGRSVRSDGPLLHGAVGLVVAWQLCAEEVDLHARPRGRRLARAATGALDARGAAPRSLEVRHQRGQPVQVVLHQLRLERVAGGAEQGERR